ncbi:MAG: HD domain-containing protein [Candidatus Hydrogenedentota bacterium]|nr:MAG: HD domain-containing protein [Candidatus Hydrogenedentota bacterium]
MTNDELNALRRDFRAGKMDAAALRFRVVKACRNLPRPDPNEVFGKEVALIENERLRDFVRGLLLRLPGYFWTIPASVIGFHRTEADNLLGGLARHSRKVARVAAMMADPHNQPDARDDLLIAGLLHDGLKYGWEGTIPDGTDHALFMAEWLEKEHIFDDRPRIRSMIRCHLGRWGRVLPTDDLDWAFHLADYLVSRGTTPHLASRFP